MEIFLFSTLAIAVLVIVLGINFLVIKSMIGKLRFRKEQRKSLEDPRFNNPIYTSDRDFAIKIQRELNMAHTLKRMRIQGVLLGLLDLVTIITTCLLFRFLR
jgi:hypothetical protein